MRRPRNGATTVGLVAAVLLVSSACSGATGQVRADVGKRGWNEVTAPHFVLVTDLGESDAREVANRLERAWSGLAAFYRWVAPHRQPPDRRLRVFYLRSKHDFERLIPFDARVAGYVTGSIEGAGERIAVMSERNGAHETLVHELVHMFNRHYLSTSPVWLNEGLATFLQTLDTRGGEVRVGSLSRRFTGLWNRPAWLSLDDLLATSSASFYEDDHKHQRYFAAWKLVHILVNSSTDRSNRFRGYLTMLSSGSDHARAWTSAFGELPAGELATAFKRYQLRRDIPVRIFRAGGSAPPPLQVRRLRAGEAHAVWAHLLLTGMREGPEVSDAVIEHLRLAESEDPSWDGAGYWKALAASMSRRIASTVGDPMALLSGHVEVAPQHVAAWRMLVTMKMSVRVPENHLGIEPDPPPGLDSIAGDVARLAEIADSPASLNTVAWYHAIHRAPAEARPYVLRALELDPGCASCLDTLALVEYHDGHLPQAVLLQQRAVNMLSEGGVPWGISQRLVEYRNAARRRPVP